MHTIKYLKPVQIYGRIWFHALKPKIQISAPPTIRSKPADAWVEPIARNVSLLGEDNFYFLNEERSLSLYGWDDASIEKLWRYNLHYFDDLNAKQAQERTEWHFALMTKWIQENPPGYGTGWEPYPTSIRIVNWVKWALRGNFFSEQQLKSLATQVRWLFKRLEYHLQGNHLFSNAKALVFAGLFFEGNEATTWLNKGLRILEKQLVLQILPDGGHFELSPMYHALALEDILDIQNIINTYQYATQLELPVKNKIAPMLRWLNIMSHPDGAFAQFNDTAFDIAPSATELVNYAERLGISFKDEIPGGMTHLPESGYIRLEKGDAVAILDVGEIGASYLPGHGHADVLSFELSLWGQRIFVNSGTSCYGNSEERCWQRSTLAHNTVCIDGQSSSEVWGGFRVGRRANPLGLHLENKNQLSVSCAHNGYQRLSRHTTHQRKWHLENQKLTIEDNIQGEFKKAQVRYYLHPSVKVEMTHNGVRLLGHKAINMTISGGQARVEMSSWHPQFGIGERNACIVVDFDDRSVKAEIEWEA